MRENHQILLDEINTPTLYSDGAMPAISRVGSLPAPLDLRKSRTSKLVSAPAYS